MIGARQTWLRHRLAVLLIPVATVAVHQLRYLLAYGAGAGRELALSGDSYVSALLPGLALLAVAAAGFGLASLLRAARGRPLPTRGTYSRARRAPSLLVLWAVAAGVLLAGYLVQESLEVALGSAHASIVGQSFGQGGWWVLPTAVLVALAWALAVRGSRAVLAYALRRAQRARHPAAARHLAGPRRARVVVRAPVNPLARRLAGRAPPLASS